MLGVVLVVAAVAGVCPGEEVVPAGEAEVISPYLLQLSDLSVLKLNKAVDFILEAARLAYTKDNVIAVKLPDIDKPFGKGLYKGGFKATGGSFRDLGSLERTGDVAVYHEAAGGRSSVGVEAGLGLRVATASYPSYWLDVLRVRQTGRLEAAAAGGAALSLRLALQYSPACALTLQYVRLDRLGDVKVNVTGLGPFQMLFNTLSSWLIENFEPSLKTIVNKDLTEKLNKVIQEKDICKHIPSL